MVATICEHITEPLQQIQPALQLAVSDQRILLPGFSQALSNCLTTTTFLLRTLAAADRHGTLCDNWAAFSLGGGLGGCQVPHPVALGLFGFCPVSWPPAACTAGKPLIQSCSILASHVAAALAPAYGLLGWDTSTWQHSPHLSPRARSAVEQCVYRLTLGAVNTLTNALDLLTACSVLKDGHATGTPASASARLKKELKARKALSTISNAIDVGSSATGSAGTCAAAAGCRTAVGCIVPTQQQEEQQQVQQEQQARAAAKAAKRQRQKQRKAAEAAAAAEAEQQTTGAAAEAPVGAAVEPAAPSPPLAYRPTSGASAPVAAPGECELPAAAPPPACPDAAAAAACDEAVQPAGSTPEGAVCPAASSSDQLEVLLAQLGAGDAELAAGAEEQAQGSGAGSSGACLLPSPLPAVPQRPSSAAQLDALLAQLGVAGGAEGREFYSAPGRVSPSPGKAADVAGGAAAYSAAPADDDSLDALLAQLGVGSCAPDGDAAAAGCASCSPAAPATAAHSPPAAAAAAPTVSLDPALLASLECPLTLQTMQQPVVAADGNTYERSAIAGEQVGRDGAEERLN